jgi:phenylalanyl-tRNA synthetase alpha subunit
MNEKLLSLKDEIKSRLGETQDLTDLDKIRVSYLGKKGSITALLKGMKDLPNEERKTMCKVQINEIERLEKDDTEIKKMRFLKTFIAARDIDSKDENYFAVFNSPAYGRCLLVFTPNEDILNGMKPHLNKNIVVQLFYKRKMS